MSLLIVPQSHTNYAWDSDGANILAESCLSDDCTPDQLKMLLSQGERILVQVKNDGDVVGWGCYRIDQLPNIRVLHITNLVGHNCDFVRFFEEMKSITRAYGATRIRCSCSHVHARLYKMKCGLTSVFETVEVMI